MALLLPAWLTACDVPRDPEATLDGIHARGAILVGLTEQPPWTQLQDGQAAGIEVELLRQLAEHLGVEPRFHVAGETELMHRLHDYELDLLIGGITADSPWVSKVSLTRSYLTTQTQDGQERKHVWAVPPGENRWLVTVERFLHERRADAAALLERQR